MDGTPFQLAMAAAAAVEDHDRDQDVGIMDITITDKQPDDEKVITITLDRHLLVTGCEPIKDFPGKFMTDDQKQGIIIDAVLFCMGMRVVK